MPPAFSPFLQLASLEGKSTSLIWANIRNVGSEKGKELSGDLPRAAGEI